MEDFEQILNQHEKIIYFVMRKLQIYKNHDYFRHIGLISLWEASVRYQGNKEQFPAYAYVCIRFALLAELKKEVNYSTRQFVTDEPLLLDRAYEEMFLQKEQPLLKKLQPYLTKDELALLSMLYLEQKSYEEVARILQISKEALKKRRDRLIKKIRSNEQIKKSVNSDI